MGTANSTEIVRSHRPIDKATGIICFSWVGEAILNISFSFGHGIYLTLNFFGRPSNLGLRNK